MSGYYSDNLLFLRKHYNSVYQYIRNKERDREKYEIIPTKSGLPNVLVRDNEDKLPVYLYSRYNPLHEVERWLDQVHEKLQEATHLLVYGFGLGYQLEQILQKYPDKKLYVFEPDEEIFLSALESRDLRNTLDHPAIVTFGVGDDPLIQRQFINYVIKQISGSFDFLSIPIYQKLFQNRLSSFQEEMQKEILDYRGNLHTVFRFQEEWTENILLNLSKNLSSLSITGLQGVFRGIPAVVVGSGPSLDLDFQYINKLKSHALIITAGSSIQALISRGISPHFAVSMDGSEANYRVFHDLDLSSIPFVYFPSIKYKIIENMHGMLLHALFEIDKITPFIMDLKEETPRFFSTASVTGSVLQLAAYFGCKKIILMGQDFSYPNDTYYSLGVDHFSEEAMSKTVADADEWIENVRGGKNRTSKRLLNTIRDIETLINDVLSGYEIINTSKIGAHIKGTNWQPIEEVYENIKGNTINDNWVLETINQNAVYYNEQKIKKTIKNVYTSCKKIKEIERLIGEKLQPLFVELRNCLFHIDRHRTRELLIEVENIWSQITDSPVFVHIYQYVLQGQISIYRRVLSQIVSETDVLKKADLVIKFLHPLVIGIQKINPKLIQYFDEAINRIDKQVVQTKSEVER